MSKSTLSLVATILAILGVAVLLDHPHWGIVTGAAFLLLAGAIGAGAMRTSSDDYLSERKPAGQKISNSLVTLSSAAILVIYAAGYHRTYPAAERFEELAARRRQAAPIAVGTVPPNVVSTANLPAEPPTIPSGATPQPRKADVRQRSKTTPKVKRAAAPPAEPVTSYFGLPSATASGEPPADPSGSNAGGSTSKYKDGTYSGWGTSRHGDIEASVVIKGGRVYSTAITQCRTRYSCSVIVHLPAQVIDRQNASIDLVSGATESSEAFSDAVSEALMHASE